MDSEVQNGRLALLKIRQLTGTNVKYLHVGLSLHIENVAVYVVVSGLIVHLCTKHELPPEANTRFRFAPLLSENWPIRDECKRDP